MVKPSRSGKTSRREAVEVAVRLPAVHARRACRPACMPSVHSRSVGEVSGEAGRWAAHLAEPVRSERRARPCEEELHAHLRMRTSPRWDRSLAERIAHVHIRGHVAPVHACARGAAACMCARRGMARDGVLTSRANAARTRMHAGAHARAHTCTRIGTSARTR